MTTPPGGFSALRVALADRRRALRMGLVGLALVGGCAGAPWSAGGDADDPVRVLAKTDGHVGGVAEPVPLQIAYDRDAAEQAWRDVDVGALPERRGPPEEAGVYGHLGDVDFSREAVVVWSFGESGTCPEWVVDVAFDGRTLSVERQRSEAQACTDDFRAATWLVAVDLARLPEPEELPVPVDPTGSEAVAYSPPAQAPRGHVDVTASLGANGETERRWVVECGPSATVTGDPPRGVDADAACEAIEDNLHWLTEPPDPDRVCTQQYGGPEQARLVGEFSGETIDRGLHRRDGCGISEWDRLTDVLGQPDA